MCKRMRTCTEMSKFKVHVSLLLRACTPIRYTFNKFSNFEIRPSLHMLYIPPRSEKLTCQSKWNIDSVGLLINIGKYLLSKSQHMLLRCHCWDLDSWWNLPLSHWICKWRSRIRCYSLKIQVIRMHFLILQSRYCM